MRIDLSPRQWELLKDQNMISLTRLDNLVPPMLEKALGYNPEHMVVIPIPDKLKVAQRFVAFYWDGKFTYTDGMLTATGQWYSWQLFLYHPRIAQFLQRFEFGADDGPPEHYLLLDREQRKIFVAPVSLAKAFLRAQRWAFLRTLDPTLPENEEDAPPLAPSTVSQEELGQLIMQWVSKQGQQLPLQFALDARREIEVSLQSWLDNPPPDAFPVSFDVKRKTLTHRFGWSQPLLEQDTIASKKFVSWCKDVQDMLEYLPLHAEAIGEAREGEPVEICGVDGTGAPIITDTLVCFNGAASERYAGEPFLLSLDDLRIAQYRCCETSAHPYDLFVMGVLLRLFFYFPEIELFSTDGEADWSEAAQLCVCLFDQSIYPMSLICR